MNKKIVSFIMSVLLSLSLVACSNNKDLEEANTIKQEQELEKEAVEDTSKDAVKEKEESEKKETSNVEGYTCPIYGSNYCPKDSECLNVEVCSTCGEYGNLTKWTNSDGCLMITCYICTESMQLEDEAHRAKNYNCSTCGKIVQSNDVEWMGECEVCLYNYNCDYCKDTGVLPGSTICDACHCIVCGVLKENCICENEYSNKCPECGGELEPNGKDADCGYGY